MLRSGEAACTSGCCAGSANAVRQSVRLGRIGILAQEARQQGTELLLFPEGFCPATRAGCPRCARREPHAGRTARTGVNIGQGHRIPGEDTQRLGEIAAETLYIHRRSLPKRDRDFSGSTLYNSIVYLGLTAGCSASTGS